MEIKELKNKIFGFRALMEKLPLCSEIGRKKLEKTLWFEPHNQAHLEKEFERMDTLLSFLKNLQTPATPLALQQRTETFGVKRIWEQMPDLEPSLAQIEKGFSPLDDLQLFELKNFLLPLPLVKKWCTQTLVKTEAIPNVEKALDLLDPLGERLPSFYIYEAYHPQLSSLRKKLKEANESEKLEMALQTEEELIALEHHIRCQISEKIKPFVAEIRKAQQIIAYWDLLMAKTEWALKDSLCRPLLVEKEGIGYQQLFYPPLRNICATQKRPYQCVDIDLKTDACLLTGANMSGKTILIKSLLLSQCLCQMGFFLPAKQARISLVDEVCWMIGDEQNEGGGLSSFGAEILRLNQVLQKLMQGKKLLFLSDEMARTTNPSEGRALVCAFFDFWSHLKNRAEKTFGSIALVSTHYDAVHNAPRRLRVKGLNTKAWQKALPKENEQKSLEILQDYMDYSLEEVDANRAPDTEALSIASCLGVNAEFLRLAQGYTQSSENNPQKAPGLEST